ncbi:MAG: GntR family transcriptional regulator [Gemmatimonadales bacterium]
MTGKRLDLAETLRQRFFSSLHLGVLEPGARLPSIRELETEFGVDRRVVLKAYRTLERDGIVERRERSGIFLGRRAPGSPSLPSSANWAVDLFVNGLAMGIPAPRLPDQLAGYFSTKRMRALVVECNSDQMSALSAELENDYGFETAAADVDELLAEKNPRKDLTQADLVVTTQFHAGEVEEISGRAGRNWIAVSLRTDIYAEIARLIEFSPVYFIVTDQRFATKLGRIFRSVKGSDNFHALLVGRDDIDSIPRSAPVYISGEARKKIHDEELLARVMPEERIFSLASAREILTLLVGSNSPGTTDIQNE